MLVAAFLLEIEGRRQVGQLDHVDVETAGRALGQDLVVERAGLRPHIAGLDFREVLAEALHDAGSAGLVLVAVENELTFLFGLRHVGVSHEIEHLGRGFRQSLRQHSGRCNSEKRQGGHRGSAFKELTSRQLPIDESGHCYSPRFVFGRLIVTTTPLLRVDAW